MQPAFGNLLSAIRRTDPFLLVGLEGPMETSLTILIGSGIVASLMACLWVYQWIRTDATIVDVGWSAGLGILSILYASDFPFYLDRPWLVATLAFFWSIRLGGYLLVNRVIGKSEDGRYRSLRQRWGERAHVYFFLFFQIQVVLAVAFSLPILTAMANPAPFGTVGDLLGMTVWLVAVSCEMIADRQLARFRRDPQNRGKVCQAGLWGYSRHPNYFFEWLHWWAYVFFAIGSGYWWISLAGPVLMLLFLLFITGIPATEAQAVASRGDAYRRYQRTTSAFIPWFPKDDTP